MTSLSIALVAFSCLFSPGVYSTQGILSAPAAEAERTIELIIVYDNVEGNPACKTDWGFSCLIRGLEKTVLFDTGTKGDILLANMKALEIDPQEIELVVLSHIHLDHTGGLRALLEINSNVDVYLPPAFTEEFKQGVRASGARVIETSPGMEICAGLYSTGQMGSAIIEQSVYMASSGGIAVMTGCAHPGIAEIVAKAKELSGRTPHLVIGGFHLVQTPDEAVRSIVTALKGMGVEAIVPTHCTGDRAIEIFRESFADGFTSGGPGAKIDFKAP